MARHWCRHKEVLSTNKGRTSGTILFNSPVRSPGFLNPERIVNRGVRWCKVCGSLKEGNGRWMKPLKGEISE